MKRVVADVDCRSRLKAAIHHRSELAFRPCKLA
jgi:hypothetical protein